LILLYRLENLIRPIGALFNLRLLDAPDRRIETWSPSDRIRCLLSDLDQENLFFCPPNGDRLFGPIDRDLTFGLFGISGYPTTFISLPRSAGPRPLFFFEIGPPLQLVGAFPFERIQEFRAEYSDLRIDGMQIREGSEPPPAGAVVVGKYQKAVENEGKVRVVVFSHGESKKKEEREVPKGTPIAIVLARVRMENEGECVMWRNGKIEKEEVGDVTEDEVRVYVLAAPMFWNKVGFLRRFNQREKMSIEVRENGRMMGFADFDRETLVSSVRGGEWRCLTEKGKWRM
jgi:hypothetical protein